MKLREPQQDIALRGGADAWDEGPAGAILTAEAFGTPGIAGTLAAEEAPDAAATAGLVLQPGATAALAATEGADVAAAQGRVWVSGALAATEGADAGAGTGAVLVSGLLSGAEGDDAAAALGAVMVSGVLAANEAEDTAAALGGVTVSGALAASEAADAMAAQAGVLILGALAAFEPADAAIALGAVLEPALQLALDVEEEADGVAGAALVGGAYLLTPRHALLLRQIHALHGLAPGAPLVVGPSGRHAGDVVQQLGEAAGVVTVATTAASDVFAGDLGTMLEELAALHGLTGPLSVSATERAAPGIVQSITTQGGITVVARQA